MGRVYSLASTLTVIFVAGLIAGALLMYSSATQQSRTTTITTTLYATYTTTATETVRDVEGVCFSRAERCDDLLAGLIRGAKDKIYVTIYSFTSDRLAENLVVIRDRDMAGDFERAYRACASHYALILILEECRRPSPTPRMQHPKHYAPRLKYNAKPLHTRRWWADRIQGKVNSEWENSR